VLQVSTLQVKLGSLWTVLQVSTLQVKGMDRKLMFYDAVLTSICISFAYSTLNG
jgi:hypothetical protein